MSRHSPLVSETKKQDLGWQDDDDRRPEDDDTRLIDEAEDALQDMEARETRRDGKHDTGGDDLSPGIDTEIDANGPKELNRSPDE
ncbi:MAG: hypothetical protein IT319_06895 [Anaerolineae bacterium]|nr:hypothetical protein [Anaerolineae bacterium]